MVSGSSNKVGDVHETSITIEGDHDHSTTEEIHKVCLPPNKTTFQSIKHYFSEIFFPDDPLHKFKNQKPSKKFFLGLQYFFPILEWGSEYSFKLLKSDVISGLTIASLAIPQGISYAKLANLPPIHGLCKHTSNFFFIFCFL
ncbi:probable sulfate transporter 3.4 [Papaver somniferum]|uniref:probable sulfate transporter 3.4 n=1 Tax=Papaver somniferum TaxID=3469 RepID=UPI000E6F8E0B|nr:probable sulfate transporter 3.4 [Papaver somniferum]XP_026410047.1 probable sulfate transporter 3.4 [Papaver somniferum]